MDRFLARCIADTTIEGIEVGVVYKIEYEKDFKIIYNETEKTFESVIGNKDWFYEHFNPLRCNSCKDRKTCRAYEKGKEYACYGFVKEN